MASLSAWSGSSDRQTDNRRVALLKSLSTGNRFYVLVAPDSGLKNADTIEHYPEGTVLGIAYPCLEDGLNDFAVIRSTFETLDLLPDDDDELRAELMEIIADAQGKLVRRLTELRDCISSGRAHFLGADLEEFKSHIINLVTKGVPRKTLDSMMKLDVFETVASTEALINGSFSPEFVYLYELLPENALDTIQEMPPRAFIGRVFQDLLTAVEDQENYKDRHTFDRNVFQKFIAVMFVNYATTDPVFYGTNKDDYGVSADKDMEQTPLYIAVGKALRIYEREHGSLMAPTAPAAADTAPADGDLTPDDQHLLAHLMPICEAAMSLCDSSGTDPRRCAEAVLRATHRLVLELKARGVLSPAVDSPVDADYRGEE
ncbi:MAG: hypothetical protein GX774_00835 [Armatimonadetes bacterium]|jgi:hypothetical protein|nr:hypothetical protein [Armatimonadota bacterium]